MEAPVTSAHQPNSTPASLTPALAPSVQLGFTVLYTTLYAVLFVAVYGQLWLLLLSKHKRCSYQSVFLFLCMFWAALRTMLFSFYFQNSLEANRLPMPVYWLFYCFPVCLQFFTLSLINTYFTQVLLKVKELYRDEVDKKMWVTRCVYGALSALFLCVNVVCAALGRRGGDEDPGSQELAWSLVLARVLVNDLLFLAEAVALAAMLLLLFTRRSRSGLPQGPSLCGTAVLGTVVILLFASRACYNLTVLTLSQNHRVEDFDFDWYNISDQADLRSELGDRGYLAFCGILFIWELLPTTLLIVIFRVRWPAQESSNSMTINHRTLPRPYFFDDPQGSEDGSPVPWAHSGHPQSGRNTGVGRNYPSAPLMYLGTGRPSATDTAADLSFVWYGSETTPLLFASHPPTQNNQHHSLYSTPNN